ncbi:uncharacterized protein LOC114315409 [Camellia sinensis]|uniref:Transmembrane protein n=1 Tax=Camellia sinensis var. sinensis TaxID=542762 RepID=A0A4S4D896_CAMSN|nr:uncharacterized protein LOC114315409 [Camellia sinensis]THF97645.1 hypothetical protein TEA_015710 [Camellia sinensis var. sinensis]
MGCKIWQQQQGGGKIKILLSSATVKEPFQILITSLLSLLLPLAFLLLARLSTAHFLFSTAPNYPQTQISSLLISLFFNTNPTLLHALISFVSVATLMHSLSGRATLTTDSPGPVSRLYTAWILLCTLQVCVGLGIEGSIAAGIDGSGFGHERSSLSKVIFFLGLHETMVYWSRTVVKPVVDDTVFGYVKEERWVERVAMAASLGTLWWWRLRGEIESLVVMVEVKRELLIGVGIADFVGWWLYYLTVTIGMVKIVKGIMWLGVILLCRRVEANSSPVDSTGNEEKV